MASKNDLIVRGVKYGKKTATVPPPVPQQESQISLVSEDNPGGTVDYFNCKTLFRELELQAHLETSLKSNTLRDLGYHQTDLQMREALYEHKKPAESVSNIISTRFKNDYERMQKMRKEVVIPESVEGLVPGITIKEQLELLRAQKYLLLQRWKAHWEAVRPPKSKWWQDKSSGFSKENRKCREMLKQSTASLTRKPKGAVPSTYRSI
ncbi:hypothetical protein HDV06_005612 [Boothiomyces sp. JEL0866]|nr:hypothetical protein HDV06_005612 [Boothiomyces sp. JEL0866]